MAKKKKIVLISHCLLNQYSRAKGVKNKTKGGLVSPIIQKLVNEKVAIYQMPCSEIAYEGLDREACGYRKYDNEEYRKICRDISRKIVDEVKQYLNEGYELSGIIGVNGSPSCGVTFSAGKGKGKGVYMEELSRIVEKEIGNVPYVGVELTGPKKISKTRRLIGRKIL